MMLHYLLGRGESEPGFVARNIHWQISVNINGTITGVTPVGDEKTGHRVNKCPSMHNMNAGGRSHFMVESIQNAAFFFKEGTEETEKLKPRHEFFWNLIKEASEGEPRLEPLCRLYANTAEMDKMRSMLDEKKAKPTQWVQFTVGEFDPLSENTVLEWWRKWRQKDLAASKKTSKKAQPFDQMLCLLSGELIEPALTHDKVKGLAGVGGLGTGDVVAGFDKDAFQSYGLDKSKNAAMGEEVMTAYVSGLNNFLEESSRKLGNAKVTHWFDRTVPLEDDVLGFLDDPSDPNQQKQEAAAAKQRATALLEAIRTGKRPDLASNKYFALTLSGASGRVMVRDWMEGSFMELVDNIAAWFNDLQIVRRDDASSLAPEPKFLAVAGSMVRELKELMGPTVQHLWRVAIRNQPIPHAFLAQALHRFRVDITSGETPNHARMGLMKAYFIRKGDTQMAAYLNPDHPDAAYHCGRLMAVLSRLQYAALGDVGANVVQRYYIAASQTPALVFGRLMSNAKNHLNKLDGGLAHWYEGKIAEVMAQMGDSMPRTLDLERQSLFALGYYQQLAADRQVKANKEEKE
ncbi:type I-C CRISPR-associated protein Cas8c/Csd1 [Desulfurispirillum indicum]|uniref:type I-C CRISPR-associated protein Cas8c/Csd1 n=1 Tax=Desulfurispirillum indicum TaxID=936456 RepID=UPI001CF964C9|nr:type I-C CRISPR-associated protein Cas8c/Csd1 [Desulfurispirillum indicum]UCZ57492.1 type I-C CRISPR-associated protein Cas8c/Csd1 [Desulfurispirillum indicum]